VRFEGSAQQGDGFWLRLESAEGRHDVRARCVVDATGTVSRFARLCGAKRLVHDRLVCISGFFAVPSEDSFSRLTLLEAVEDGWWYAAKLPDRKVAVAFASDPEIFKAARPRQRDSWLAGLRETRHIATELAAGSFIDGSLRACVAPSFQLDKVAGVGWVAVGDAASAFDPISSQGVYKALADALRAAPVIVAQLAGERDAFAEYQPAQAARFAGYLAQRDYFYGGERRWPGAPFWRKRRAEGSSPKVGDRLPNAGE
jgi:flavin-dependent dehydrogenase